MIYGYKSDSIVGIDLNGDLLRSIKLPSSSKIPGRFSNNDYNKFTFAIKDNNIYYTNDKGIYRALENETEFSMIVDNSEAEFLKENFTLVDMAVNTKGEIYILAINGLDEEWPTDLFILEIK